MIINLFETYLLSKKLSNCTVSSYLCDIKSFLLFENFNLNFKTLTLNDFRRYFSSRKDKNIKASSNARAISSIKAFYKMLKKNGICNNTEILKLTSPKLPKTLPKALQIDEVKEFLYEPEEEGFESQRNKALITLIYSTGMRVSEAISLNKRDFIKNADFIKVIGKGNKERSIPLIQKAKDEIEKYIKLSPIPLLPDYPLFIKSKRDVVTGKPIRLSVREFQKIMQNQRIAKDLPNFATPHSLRHSFATHIIAKGGDVRSVQSLLGHASLSTTQKYIKVDEATLKYAYNRFHNFGMTENTYTKK